MRPSAFFPLPADCDPILTRVLAHWIDLHPAEGVLPGRQHFDPAVLAAQDPLALPHLWLLDVEGEPRRFRLRLIGTALRAAGSPGRPGAYLDEVDGTGETTAVLTRVCNTGEPHYRRGRPRLPHGDHVRELEVLTLPLARDGRRVDMLLICTMYHWVRGREPVSITLG